MLERVNSILSRLDLCCFGTKFEIKASYDKAYNNGRVYLQVSYYAKCNKDGEEKEWFGRKWLLSEYMTDDEIIKTSYTAFKSVVEHEVMEGFKVDNIILFNPHINYEELLNISHKEVSRENN